MVPYSGYSMPVSYSGLNHEHKAVREAVGMFDVSHMGEFTVKGKDAINLLQYITSIPYYIIIHNTNTLTHTTKHIHTHITAPKNNAQKTQNFRRAFAELTGMCCMC